MVPAPFFVVRGAGGRRRGKLLEALPFIRNSRLCCSTEVQEVQTLGSIFAAAVT
jgi:hypothetical protein